MTFLDFETESRIVSAARPSFLTKVSFAFVAFSFTPVVKFERRFPFFFSSSFSSSLCLSFVFSFFSFLVSLSIFFDS